MPSGDYAKSTESMQADAEVLPGGSASVSSVQDDVAAAVTEEPWTRVKQRIAIPEPPDTETLDQLSAPDFARLVREHLLPAKPQGPERDAWSRLWTSLQRDDQLADRAFDVLEHMINLTQTALDGPLSDIPDPADDHDEAIAATRAQSRATRFLADCQNAWDRLEITSGAPLAWAGRAAAAYNPPARVVIQQLVTAIDQHRQRTWADRAEAGPNIEPTEADRELWAVLDRVHLDPNPRSASAAFRRTHRGGAGPEPAR